MELEVRTVGGMEDCFVSLPLLLIQTLERRSSAMDGLPELLVLELRDSSSDEVWMVSWSGATSSSSAIEVSKQFADCISLPDCIIVQVRATSYVPEATQVSIEPYSEDDWEVLELNAELAEAATLNQVRIIHEGMRFPLWLHGRTAVTFLVVSTSPKRAVVKLVQGTKVVVAPKTREKVLDSREGSPIQSSCMVQAKAVLRVQDLDKRLICNSTFAGIELRVVPTSVAFIHPQTAKNFSLNSLELVSILPRSSGKESGNHNEINDLRKLKSSTAETNSGERTNGEESRQAVIYLLNSNLVNEGHIMIARSLRLYLRINLHSWVLVKQHKVNLKEGFSSASLSLCYFKVLDDDMTLAKNDLKASDSHKSVKRKNMMFKTSSWSYMDVANSSAHDQVVEVLSHESPGSEDEGSCCLSGVKKGLQILLQEWFLAHLNAMACSVGNKVNAMRLGNQSLLHFEVNGLKSGTRNINSAPLNASEDTTKTVEILYVMTILQEPLQGVCSNAFELSFDDLNKCVIKLGSAELSEKLHLGDPISFSTIKEKTYVEGDSLDVSSLSWLDASLPDVINRIKVLLSPTAGRWFGTHNLPLPGHILLCGPPGSGKTLLARAAAKFLQEYEDLLAHVVFVCCSRLASEKVQTIRQSLLSYISEALDHAPSLIIFDDLDSIILSTSDSEGFQPSTSMSAMSEFLTDMIDEYEEKRKSSCQVGPIAFVASVQTLDKIPQSLRSSGRFDFHMELPAPAASERAAILKHEIQRRSLDCSDVTLQEIASKCDGYDAYDLEILVDRAVHAAVSRFLPLHLALNQKQHPTLIENDFSLAMNEFVPASMRDITKPAAEGGRSGWDDVGGLVEVKNSIKEMLVLPSKFPNIFSRAPLRLRSNVLLYGPPGCGKTHIVGAAAAACSLRFISVKGPELLNKYIGASEQAVRDIFSKATAAAPCILFFDEFDSIAPKRGHDNTGVTDRVVNQFLTELDGVEVLTGVFVFAATSRPDLLDAALLRPGRLDRLLFCDFPSPVERLNILQVLSTKLPLASDVDLEAVAYMTEGYSGADLQALLSDAQLAAVHEHLDSMNANDPAQKPIITDAILKAATAKARPSVSDAEKQRLYGIYRQFLDSKKSVSMQTRDAKGKRATLA
ncbi:peroxisome biogenesis protein 1 isoform X2 [Momordica charantia]|uniref:Peroxisomal ATPase PEX1 n=1 Tax=Momordica charantia TaxID=3673 RepID=A0A6J1CLK6_MOMCH|nr:peroxisome biogenesis protein 1 isoform X2 [Momordica charantia]